MVKTGEVIEGRYRVIKTLGTGATGSVFLAEHTQLKRRVAIKVLSEKHSADAAVVDRFVSEARAAGTLGNANIVESTDLGFVDGVPYIVFEYLEGTLLTDEVYRVGGLPVRRVIRIAMQVASALRAAHDAGIVHRGLESDSVFLTDKDDTVDHVKVLDFGSSRLRGAAVRAPDFLAPEQITAPLAADSRADIYALGVIMYEMLTARRPFSSDEDPRAMMRRIVKEEPPPLQRNDVPPALAAMILDRLLAKTPSARFASMGEVEDALAELANEVSGVNRRTPSTQPANDVARNSDLIPRPAMMIDTAPVSRVAPRKPWLMYGIAAAGVLVGGIGLAVGLRGGGTHEVTAQVAPLPAAATPVPREDKPAQKIQVELASNAPNARVVFRRRITAAPASMQIAPSDIVELVEVSAPGYKTSRYWLTFDRPTKLHATLVKGSGLEEASEEATLIALGEVTAPPPAAAAAIAVAAPASVAAPVAMTVAKPVEPTPVRSPTIADAAPAPRKIGREAAEQMAAEPTPAPVEEPAPAIAEPEPAPVAAVEPEPVPVKAEPVPEPVKVEPAVARPAIDRATVSSVIGQHRMEVLKCIGDGKKKNAQMKGTLTLQLQVEANGKVRAQVQSTLSNPLVAACVVKSANEWRFPSRASGDLAAVAYPFTIN